MKKPYSWSTITKVIILNYHYKRFHLVIKNKFVSPLKHIIDTREKNKLIRSCYITYFNIIPYFCKVQYEVKIKIVPNQELSGAKSELQGVTVGVRLSYKRSGQPPYNLPAVYLRFTPRSLQVCLLAHFNKWSAYK